MTPVASFPTLTESHLASLRSIVGSDHLRTDDTSREAYGRDETEDLEFRPAAVVLPADAAEIAALLRLAHAERLPLTPRGAGTGLSGGALPVRGGILLSLERLDRILEVDRDDLLVRTEAGVVTAALQRRVEEDGLFYPPDPASRESCLIGGNIAEDAAGPRSCRYGTTGAWVMGLEAVLADGSRIATGGRNRKDVAGYDLTRLLVGSEGTLAVVTAATLRLIARPAATLTVGLPFDALEDGAATVAALFREGHDPAACELMEARALELVGEHLALPPQLHGLGALLLLELHGDDGDGLLEDAAALAELAAGRGAGEALVARESGEQRRLWGLREKIGEAVRARSVYKEADTVVPRAALADLVRAARRAAGENGLEVVCYGHAGDGNLHVNLLRGERAEGDWEERRDAAEEALFRSVLDLGGSITGEHGVGWTQRRFLEMRLGAPQVELMRRLKAAFDPRGILNPGKIFPDLP